MKSSTSACSVCGRPVSTTPTGEVYCPECNTSAPLHELATTDDVDGTVTHNRSPDDKREDDRAPPGYEILDELGRGGMGVVYRAYQCKLQRPCALKMILAGGHAGEQERQRFETEAQAIARLRHPGIVQVYEIGEHRNSAFMALELCEGGSLDRRLRRHPPTPREAAEMVHRLSLAMQAAHEAQVIHRDLKPANVLITADGALKVTDFGLAKKLDEEDGRTRTGAVMGTPSYMPPEQALGRKDLGPTADIYALGAILYAALTGRPPFRGATTMETIQQVLTKEPVAVQELNPAVPKDLATIAHKCLQKDPGKRYSTASALADDLARFLDGRPIQARPVSALERGLRWCKRNKLVAGLWAAVMGVLILGIGVASYFAIQAEEKAQQYLLEKDVADRQRRRAEGLLYAAEIRESMEYWDKGRIFEAEEVFYSCPVDLRGWEHDYLFTLFTRSRKNLITRRAGFSPAAFSPDRKTFATSGPDKTVKLWSLLTGKELRLLKGQTLYRRQLTFSPDGRYLVSATSIPVKSGTSTPIGPAEISMWEVNTGKMIFSVKAHKDFVHGVAVSPDNQRVATGSQDRTVQVWDVKSGKAIFTKTGFHRNVVAVLFDPTGEELITVDLEKVKFWDSRSGEEIHTIPTRNYYCNVLKFSPDGKRLAGGCSDGNVRMWDAVSKKELFSADVNDDPVTHLAFDRTGKRLVVATDKIVRVLNAGKGDEIHLFRGHREKVTAVAFSEDDKHVLSSSSDGTVKVWDAENGQKPFRLLKHEDYVNSVAFSPDGKRLLTASDDKEIRIWDAATGGHLRSFAGHTGIITSVAVSTDGARIISGGKDKTVRVWDAKDGRSIHVLKGHASAVTCVAFSPDGRWIASGDEMIYRNKKIKEKTGMIKLWSGESGKEIHSLNAHQHDVLSLAFSPDGTKLASAGGDKMVKLWDVVGGNLLFQLEGHEEDVTCVAFSPDGTKIVSGSKDKTIKIWDLAARREIHTLRKHSDMITSVAYSPDGTRIVSGSWDNTVRLWEPELGYLTLTMKGHTEKVLCVAFSPDGKRIASGGEDDAARIWEATLQSSRTEAVLPSSQSPSMLYGQGGGY